MMILLLVLLLLMMMRGRMHDFLDRKLAMRLFGSMAPRWPCFSGVHTTHALRKDSTFSHFGERKRPREGWRFFILLPLRSILDAV